MDEETYAEQIRMCASCPKMCRHVCPTFSVWKSDGPTPHGRAMLLHYEEIGTRNLDERAVEVIYQCLQCSHCLTWCLPEIDIASIVEMARERIVEQGKYPVGLERMKQSISAKHNPFDESHESRTKWKEETSDGEKHIIYFSGCTAAYREQSIAKATVQLLASLNYSVSVLDDEWCCGSPLLRTGFVMEARNLATHNVQMLNEIDAEMIVTSCPGCFRVLSSDYPSIGLQLNKPIKHISEILANNIHACAGIRETKRITYHDPCHLGRHSGIYDEPRNVISKSSGQAVTEMERNRENATCCGNGAGLRTLFPEHAKKIGKCRLDDAKNVEAEILVTSCPFCKNLLSSQSDSIEVYDLTEFTLKMTKG